MTESPETTPLSAAEEQAIRRNVAEMAKAEWGDNPGTAYHPEEQCKSERQLVRLLEAFDAARATVPAGQDIVAAAQRVVDAKPVRWNDRPADSFIRAVLDLRYALAARPVPAAEPRPITIGAYDSTVHGAVPAADTRKRLALTPLQREVETEPVCSRCDAPISTLGGLYRCASCHASFHYACICKHFGWSINGQPHAARH
jgi:hypothetical protein